MSNDDEVGLEEKVDITDIEWIIKQIKQNNSEELTFISQDKENNIVYKIKEIETNSCCKVKYSLSGDEVGGDYHTDCVLLVHIKSDTIDTEYWTGLDSWESLVRQSSIIQYKEEDVVEMTKEEKIDFILSHPFGTYFRVDVPEYPSTFFRVNGVFESKDEKYIDYTFQRDFEVFTHFTKIDKLVGDNFLISPKSKITVL